MSGSPAEVPGGNRDAWAREAVDDGLLVEWDALAVETRAVPFLRPGWFQAWMAAFAPGRTLRALTVRRAGTLVALLPVLESWRGVSVPANTHSTVIEPLAVDEAAARALVPALLGGGWRTDLRFVPAGGLADVMAAEAGDRGWLARREVMRQPPFTLVEGDWEAYQREQLSKNRRHGLARLARRLEEMGDVRLDVQDGGRNLAGLLAEGFGLERSGWKGDEGTAVLSRPDTEQFYREVAEWAARTGLLRLYFLRLDGRAIAFLYTVEQHGVSHVLKLGFDDALRDRGPGVLVARAFLQDAFARPDLRKVDWLGEDDRYKRDFATGVRDQLRLQFYAPGVLGRADRALADGVAAARAEARRRLPPETRHRIGVSAGRLRARLPIRGGAQSSGAQSLGARSSGAQSSGTK